MKINQFCLLPEVYTKQTKLSDGLDRMPWRKGAAESEKQTEAEGKSLPVGDKWFQGGRAPGENVVSQDTDTHPMSTKNMAKNACRSELPPTTPLTWNFSCWQFILFFYKKLGCETLKPERQIFSAHLSLPISITVDISMPGWRQTIKVFFLEETGEELAMV